MQIHTQNVIILPPAATADSMASMERLMQSIGRAEAPAISAQPGCKPQIGDYWPNQGGFYAGDMRGDDGTIYGLIVSDCHAAKDVGTAAWGPGGKHELSEWDGLVNTQKLAATSAAAKRAVAHSADQHSDFYLPARRELQLACATVPHLFGTDDWYWTSTPRFDDYAWAVDFERGGTIGSRRGSEFRVRPVRRFIY